MCRRIGLQFYELGLLQEKNYNVNSYDTLMMKLAIVNNLKHYVVNTKYSMVSLPFRLSSCDKTKSMLVKGLLIESNKTCLTALSVIIHKVTHGDI